MAAELIGEDGHPLTGGFLPDVGSRARMWAGGRLAFSQPLKVCVPAKRVSTIEHIQEKEGRSGSLLFVTVRRSIYQHDELMLTEEQDIVIATPALTKSRLVNLHPTPNVVNSSRSIQSCFSGIRQWLS